MLRATLVGLLLASALLVFTGVDRTTLTAVGGNSITDTRNRALTTFASARALNGVISVMQGTELSAEPLGFGVTFTPGQVLDPVNDLVERFSWIMLLSATSIGVQEVLLEIAATREFAFALGLGLLCAAGCQFLSYPLLRGISVRVLLALLLLRLVPVVSVITSQAIYDHLLSDRYTQGVTALDGATRQIDATNRALQAADSGAANASERSSRLDNLLELPGRTAQALENMLAELRAGRGRLASSIDAPFAELRQLADQVADRIIDLIVVFLVQTVAIPLLFLWLTLRLLTVIARPAQRP